MEGELGSIKGSFRLRFRHRTAPNNGLAGSISFAASWVKFLTGIVRILKAPVMLTPSPGMGVSLTSENCTLPFSD